ncbi:transaldolase [Scleromatobacter humisilvae]|uniref:Transaldolase n=1 Tax=Scleromatobacter humisilvae TaxID=2897159 RepID=A0A9X2C1A1_9BURK|nr:transaldolase [Scleromatobacter humisilvae]MCK9685549.1 transaldolase [Scleromatobacter humisilvae]
MSKTTQQLHELGQSLWIDNISRETLRDGSLAKLISDYSVTGLTSNPSIFEKAMGGGDAYDDAIAQIAREGRSTEDLFFALAVDDLQHAADLFLPAHEASGGVDGWVSLEVSPLLVNDTRGTVQAAASLHTQAARKNLFIKIPGTPEGIPAIEDSIHAGIPINVTLLFSREQYLAAAEAYMKGIERRLNDGKSPVVESVASLFVSRWDTGVKDAVSAEYQNKLGIAIAMRTYKAYRDLLASERWKKLAAAGAHPQRLLWASTGTKDPKAPETLYVEALAAPDTVDTMPEKTLRAFAKDGKVGTPMPVDGGHAEQTLDEIRRQGVDIDALALKLQQEGGDSFKKSWSSLIGGLEEKVTRLTATSPS